MALNNSFRMRRCLALLALGIGVAVSGAQAQLSLSIDTLDASGFPVIRAKVRVTDGGASVRNLSVIDFTVFEDGLVQAPVTGNCDDTIQSGPVSVLLAIDRSNSMGPWPVGSDAIVDAKRAASDFVDRLSVDDEAAVLSFNANVSYNQPWTRNKTALKGAINAITTSGGTAIWNAVLYGANLLGGRSNKRIMILLTDGRDSYNNIEFAQARDSILANGIIVYAIGLGNSIDAQLLMQIAQASGGRYYNAPDASDLDQIYRDISTEISATGICELRYTTRQTCLDGRESLVEIEVEKNGRIATGSARFRVPFDSSSFSYLDLSIPSRLVVETGAGISIPVTLTRLTPNRPVSALRFTVSYNTAYLRFEGARTMPLTTSFIITDAPTPNGISIALQGPVALQDTGAIVELTFSAFLSDVSVQSPLAIAIAEPSFASLCTVTKPLDGDITVSGSCERAIVKTSSATGLQTQLLSVAPNPFNPSTRIGFSLAREEHATVSVYNSLGREVAALLDATLPAGAYEVAFDASSHAGGAYFVRFTAGEISNVKSILLLK